MRSVIFVSPHPDDIELFCGGTLLEHANSDDHITVILMSKGGKGTLNPFLSEKKLEQIREREALARYGLIKNATLIFSDFKDKQIMFNDTSVAIISNIMQQLSPEIIYIPEFLPHLSLYTHQDHFNTGNIFVNAAQRAKKSVQIRCYHSNQTNLLINIEKKHYEQNNQALKFYKSQNHLLSNQPFTISRLTRQYNKKRREWGGKNGHPYAEGFREFRVCQSINVAPGVQIAV